MKAKSVYLGFIFLAAYLYFTVNYPAEWLKPPGYAKLMDVYGDTLAQGAKLQILYNPGLRRIDIDLYNPRIMAVMPHARADYPAQMRDFQTLPKKNVIIECSGLDTWHTTPAGSAYLPLIYRKAYRVVIFDGGHHLPGVGLSPDIIIVPQYAGYAAHGYMPDGMRVEKLRKLLVETGASSILVAVPRFRLVKTESSLTGITREILKEASFREDGGETYAPCCRSRVSKYHGRIFAYINYEYVGQLQRLLLNIKELGAADVDRVYLAFDYSCLSPAQADDYCAALEARLGIPVERVNEPVKVSDLLLRRPR